MAHGSLYSFVWQQRERGVIPYETNRDLRRTFKMIAQGIAIMKTTLDRLVEEA